MPTLTVTMGLPGSGKTTWAREQSGIHVGTDAARTQRDWTAALDTIDDAARRTRDHLRAGHDVTVDPCAISQAQRQQWLAIARDAGARARLVVVHTPAVECERRNMARPIGERVPYQRMARYQQQWAAALRAVEHEDWDDIVHVGDAEQAVQAHMGRDRW